MCDLILHPIISKVALCFTMNLCPLLTLYKIFKDGSMSSHRFNPFHLSGSRVALVINDADIQYYYMDKAWSIHLNHSYFINPDYLVVKF